MNLTIQLRLRISLKLKGLMPIPRKWGWGSILFWIILDAKRGGNTSAMLCFPLFLRTLIKFKMPSLKQTLTEWSPNSKWSITSSTKLPGWHLRMPVRWTKPPGQRLGRQPSIQSYPRQPRKRSMLGEWTSPRLGITGCERRSPTIGASQSVDGWCEYFPSCSQWRSLTMVC